MKIRRPIFFLPLALVVVLYCPMRAHAQNFTLEQVTSSPFPTELTVSKRGDKIALARHVERGLQHLQLGLDVEKVTFTEEE